MFLWDMHIRCISFVSNLYLLLTNYNSFPIQLSKPSCMHNKQTQHIFEHHILDVFQFHHHIFIHT